MTSEAQVEAKISEAKVSEAKVPEGKVLEAEGLEAKILEVKGLQTVFFTNSGLFKAVDDVSFDVRRGETLAIVGESGCGKSVSALSIMRLVPDPPGRIVGGTILLEGTDLLGLDEARMREIRGNRISMIFQEPMTSLNPVMRIGDQITEAVRLHRTMTAKQAREQAVEMLRLVRIPEPARRAREYPHQLSGGMRQRAMIAMALACQTAQRVIVMYAGKKVEEADVDTLFASPLHPYTRGLMASIPAVPTADARHDVRLAEIPGTVPSLTKLPVGCAFAPRCSLAIDRCREQYPPLQDWGGGHLAACWRAAETATRP